MLGFMAGMLNAIDKNVEKNQHQLHQIGCRDGIEDDCHWMKENE